MNWKKKGMIVALVGAVASAGIGGYVAWRLDYPVHHFAVVREGVLYRSGGPAPEQLRHLVDKYGIRTVVNLRGQRVQSPWWRGETAFCGQRGLNMVDIEMSDGAAAQANIVTFLDIVGDPANRPVLVHCEAGSARTGFAVAAYRIVFDGWTCDKALAEAVEFHFKTGHTTNQEYENVLRRLAEGGVPGVNRWSPASAGASTSPASRAGGL